MSCKGNVYFTLLWIKDKTFKELMATKKVLMGLHEQFGLRAWQHEIF